MNSPHFQFEYKKFTPFAMEPMINPLHGRINYGGVATTKLCRSGDFQPYIRYFDIHFNKIIKESEVLNK